MSEYKVKLGKIGKTVIDAYKAVEEKFVDTFLEEDGSLKTGRIAEKVTRVYKKVEDSVVGTYKKVEDAFVDAFLEKKTEQDATAPRPAEK